MQQRLSAGQCAVRPGCCASAGVAVVVGTAGCTAGSTGFSTRWSVLVGLASTQWQPVVQAAGLVEQPAESVPGVGGVEQCCPGRGRGPVAGAGSAGGSGETLLLLLHSDRASTARQGVVAEVRVELPASVERRSAGVLGVQSVSDKPVWQLYHVVQ